MASRSRARDLGVVQGLSCSSAVRPVRGWAAAAPKSPAALPADTQRSTSRPQARRRERERSPRRCAGVKKGYGAAAKLRRRRRAPVKRGVGPVSWLTG